MRRRHRAGSIHFLIIALLMVAAGGDAAGAQDRWPPWQSREDAEDAARKAPPKRRSQPKVKNASPAIDAAGAQVPAAPPGQERAAPPAAQQVEKPPSTPGTAIESAATAGARAATKTEIVPLTPHSEGVTAVVFSPNGAQVLSGSYDKTMKLWDTASGALIRTFEGHKMIVTSACLRGDSETLAGTSWVVLAAHLLT